MNPEAVWYGARHPLALALAPLGGLYCALATLRALAYHRDWLPSHAAGAPTLPSVPIAIGAAQLPALVIAQRSTCASAGLVHGCLRIYTLPMRITWDEAKRRCNLTSHGLDFVDVASVFQGLTYTFEDDRIAYGEQRFITLGLLYDIPVSIAHTETEYEIRVISFRKATTREVSILFGSIGN